MSFMRLKFVDFFFCVNKAELNPYKSRNFKSLKFHYKKRTQTLAM